MGSSTGLGPKARVCVKTAAPAPVCLLPPLPLLQEAGPQASPLLRLCGAGGALQGAGRPCPSLPIPGCDLTRAAAGANGVGAASAVFPSSLRLGEAPEGLLLPSSVPGPLSPLPCDFTAARLTVPPSVKDRHLLSPGLGVTGPQWRGLQGAGRGPAEAEGDQPQAPPPSRLPGSP